MRMEEEEEGEKGDWPVRMRLQNLELESAWKLDGTQPFSSFIFYLYIHIYELLFLFCDLNILWKGIIDFNLHFILLYYYVI